jgi:hypothetical protein
MPQQPPLQSCVVEHEVVHWCVVVSQASVAGQSVGPLHPQLPPFDPTTHCAPASAAMQLVQVPPPAPHAVGTSGEAQVAPLQHVPLHG